MKQLLHMLWMNQVPCSTVLELYMKLILSKGSQQKMKAEQSNMKLGLQHCRNMGTFQRTG
uniref:Uncharacterized protein n=1 Tax=Arundo donax TaxID=35708 RepID=A0A0A9F619_ARUDO